MGERETATKAIEVWRANPATTFISSNILREFGDVILEGLNVPAQERKLLAVQHDHRVYFMCESCEDHNPEGAVSVREDIGVMPDGTWLCSDCYADCDKSAYGMVANDVDDFEFPHFYDLEHPPVVPAAPIDGLERGCVMAQYPEEMTPELREVLGTICFQCIPFVRAFRAAGIEIPKKAEAEQAYVLHWMIGLVLRHGAGWRAAALAEMDVLRTSTFSPPNGGSDQP